MNPAAGDIWTIGQGTIEKVKQETGIDIGKEVIIMGTSNGQFEVKDMASGTAFSVSRRQLGKPVQQQPFQQTPEQAAENKPWQTNINPVPITSGVSTTRICVTRGQATFPGRESVPIYALELTGEETGIKQVFLDRNELFKTLETLI